MDIKKENQRVRLTKTLLKDQLIILLKQKPISQITVTEICSKAEINRSTFYKYYYDQYSLLNEVENDIIVQTDEYVTKINTDCDSIQYLVELLTYIRENSDIFLILLNPSSNVPFQNKIMNSILARIQEKTKPIDATKLSPYTYQYLLSGSFSIVQQWIRNNFDISVFDIAKILYNFATIIVASEVNAQKTNKLHNQ